MYPLLVLLPPQLRIQLRKLLTAESDAAELAGAVGELADGDVDAGLVLDDPLGDLELAGVADGRVVVPARRGGRPRRLHAAVVLLALLLLLPCPLAGK